MAPHPLDATPGAARGMKKKISPKQSFEEFERLKRLQKIMHVLVQPHRRGDDSDMADALGVFVRREFPEDQKDSARRCWEAGYRYKLLVAKWRRVKGIPQVEWLEDETPSGGGDIDEKRIAEWGQEIKQCEEAMKCSGIAGFRAAQCLILERTPPRIELHGPVRRAVVQLAICLGFL